jgi:hypothetical protein
VAQSTRGSGTFGVFQGTTNGNAQIQFTTTGNVWQMTANDLTSYSTVITTANVQTAYSTDSANAASLTAVKGANDNALAAYASSNTAANTVRVSANTLSTIHAASGVNFTNSATITCTVASGNAGNANVSFAVVGGTAQGATGAQGSTGAQGFNGSLGTQGSTGAQGTTGAGTQGSTGAQGTTGAGTQGAQGGTGIQGAGGTQGATGAGTQGAQGATAAQGATGIQGNTGPQGTTGAQGATGTQGTTGSQGTTGAQGTQGTTGAQGVQGIHGYNGGTVHVFNTGTTADTDPGNGYFHFNNATIGSVSFIYIDAVDFWGVDRQNYYASFDDSNTTTNRGTLLVNTSGSTADGVVFRVTGAVTTVAGYSKIPVAWISGTMPTNGAVLSFVFAPAGTQGQQGNSITGSQGGTGSQGPTGTQGATGAGTQGATGASTQGTTGSQGATGTQGGTGAQGTSGASLSGGASPYFAVWSSASALTYASAYNSGGTVVAPDFAIASDARLKNVSGQIYDSLRIIHSLTGIRYTWNNLAVDLGYTPNAIETGLLAQQVQAVLPEAVQVGNGGYLVVKYERLIPVLIEAIKELSERVKQLELEV